jgi:hypothetical protein
MNESVRRKHPAQKMAGRGQKEERRLAENNDCYAAPHRLASPRELWLYASLQGVYDSIEAMVVYDPSVDLPANTYVPGNR